VIGQIERIFDWNDWNSESLATRVEFSGKTMEAFVNPGPPGL